jgi:hypothetical protein
MAASSSPVVRLRSPGEIAAAVPLLCGFLPTESLVAVSLRGDRRRIGLTLRVDLPTCADDDAAGEIVSRLAHDGASAAVFVVYTDEPGSRPRDALVEALVETSRAHGITVMEALHVRSGRWSSYTCDHPGCCPVDGTPIATGPAVETLAASAALEGRAVLRDRDELVASLAPPVLLAARAAEQRLDAALVERLADVASRGQAAARAAAVAAVRAALHDEQLSAEAVAAIAVSLQDVLLRDEVALLALEDTDALLALLLRLARETVAPYDVPVCTLVALVSWVRGDGALANVALDRALSGDPGYGMATLLRAGLDGQLPPSAVRQWLRETRRALNPPRRRRRAA